MLHINDRIHGTIEISPLAQSIIDTPEFQRLRRICQAGVLQWVFPSANHSRFEHSIGVYHLAKIFAKNLTWKLDIHNKDRLCEIIGLGGLVHDLGHLAFSHLFETFMKGRGMTFHHEELSQKLFNKICNQYKIKLTDEEKIMISNIVHPPDEWQTGFIWNKVNIGKWVYQIVASPITGIDVDKFDYLLRDSASCGLSVSFNFDRIIKMAKIIQGEIVFPWKLRFNIFEMYLSRYQLHLRVYHHKAAIALEILVLQILEELSKEDDFETKINKLDILDLTDNIIFNYKNKKITDILFKIETRNYPKLTTKDKAKYLIPITNSLCNEDENPLTKIKYLNKTDNIIYATVEDYGLLASHSYTHKVNYYFE